MKVIPCMDSAVQENEFELIPTIRMKRGHSVDGSLSRHFSSIYVRIRLSDPDPDYNESESKVNPTHIRHA